MDALKDDHQAGALHHAYLLARDENTLGRVVSFAENYLRVPCRGNPDVVVLEEETITIALARYIKEMESRKATSGTLKLFLISFDFMTREAQQALLKVLEEPNTGTHFFLLTPFPGQFLSTLRSRVCTVGERAESSERVEMFLKASVAERLVYAKEIAEGKNRVRAINFLSALEQELYRRFTRGEFSHTEIFTHIGNTRSYLSDRSPSLKILMEGISILVPQIK